MATADSGGQVKRSYALQYHRRMVEDNAAEAQKALDAKNYSEAATWAHRAHQHKLIADTLKDLEEDK
jgi:hypothetical protein